MSAFDRWLADDRPFNVYQDVDDEARSDWLAERGDLTIDGDSPRTTRDEYDPPCPKCGHLCSDHIPMQVVDLDGNDFETMCCPA